VTDLPDGQISLQITGNQARANGRRD